MKVAELLEEKGFNATNEEKLGAVKKGIADTLKMVRYRVLITKASTQNEPGVRYILKVGVPFDQDDSDFYSRMVKRILQRELMKHFDRFKITEVHVSRFKSDDKKPNSVDDIYITFYVPDLDGKLPD